MNNLKCIFFASLLILAGSVYADSSDIIEFPDRGDITLENGLRIILIEHYEQPTISYRFMVKAGMMDNPLGKEGLAEVTSQLLRAGTSSRTQNEIVDTTALISSTINISIRSQYTSVGLDVLKQYAEIGFDIFADVILDSIFPSQELQRVRKEYVNYVKMELTDNHKISYNHGNFLLFGPEHPLGHVRTERSLKSLSDKDVRTFYQTFYRPNNAILLVIGDFSQEDMLAGIKKKFGRWKKAELAERIQTKVDFSKGGSIRAVDKPNMTQAVIHLKQWGIDSGHKDYYAYQLMNYILGGGGFSSRLFEAVRAEGGKTYGIRSSYSGNPDYGVFSITTSTRNEQLLNTYRLIQSELKKLIDEGITAEELKKAKAYKAGSIPLQLEAPGMIANKVLKAIANGFTIDDLSKEIVYYKRVSLEDVNRVIKEYLKPGKLNVVIVGDVKKIKGQLENIGHYKKVYYKKPPN